MTDISPTFQQAIADLESLLYRAPWPRNRLLRALYEMLEGVWIWIELRTILRLHVVKTRLSPGMWDVDHVMFHACFTLLGRFVENELGIASVDEEGEVYRGYRMHGVSGTDQKAVDLWRWYVEDLQTLEDKGFYGEYVTTSETKFAELMAIRTQLWT